MTDKTVNSFTLNKETELVPILGLVEEQVNAVARPDTSASSVEANHHAGLLSLLADELSVSPEEVHDFDLSVTFLLSILPT